MATERTTTMDPKIEELIAKVKEQERERSERPAVVHIRRKLRRSRSTNFYLDRSDRYRGTICGADATQDDWDLRSAKAKKNRRTLEDGFEGQRICPACIAGMDAGEE